MTTDPHRPLLVVEDDVILRLFQVVLDPDTPADRVAAFAHWIEVDQLDFEGWRADARRTAGPLYPAEVRLVDSQEQLRAFLPEAVGLVVESLRVGLEELAVAERLRAVQQFSATTANIDTAACAARGVRVLTQRRRVNASVAELTFALMLALAKRLPRIMGQISVEQLTAAGFSPTTFDRRHTTGAGWSGATGLRSLNGSTLGILGLGGVGREVARRAVAFDMHVLYFQRHRLDPSEEAALQATHASFDSLLAESDWVSIHLPLTTETRNLIDRRRFFQMKSGARLVNTSRADIVDRHAVIEGLASGRLGGFALDPLYEEPGKADDPLLGFDNVILTPHVAALPRTTTLDDAVEMLGRLASAIGPG